MIELYLRYQHFGDPEEPYPRASQPAPYPRRLAEQRRFFLPAGDRILCEQQYMRPPLS